VRRPIPVGPPARGRTGPFERLARVPDHRIVDRLLRSRLCIWVIGIMLGGIVFMQVSLLRMNTGISRAVATQTTFERQNATLQAQIAKITSGDRVRDAALKDNMIDPPAGSRRFLTARESDVPRALRRMKPPSQTARDVMANGGYAAPEIAGPGTVVATSLGGATATQVQPSATPNPLPTPGATPVPAATAAPLAATPVPTVTVAPPLPTPGATTAPTG
jgi:hypothetical protein